MKVTTAKFTATPADGTTACVLLLIAGMLTSPFLLSVSMWGLVGMALWESNRLLSASGQRPSPGRTLAFAFSRYVNRPGLWIFSLLLLIPAIAGLWSEDLHFWMERTRVRIPFFVLPWVFANLPILQEKQRRLVLYCLVGILTILCLGVAINYLLHEPEILEGLAHGHAIPVPRNHIRFNLNLAVGILACGWLWFNPSTHRPSWERPVLAILLVFLFVFIHFLSVRSGLAALYMALLFTVIRFIVRTRRYRIGLAILILLALIPFAALQIFPSLQQRMAYMRYDWQKYKENAGDDYSDSERWISFKAGLQLWRENPVLGVGTGDLPAEIARVVVIQNPAYAHDPRLPHNQFIYLLAGTGLFGLIGSLIALLYPVFSSRSRNFYLFAVFQVIVFTSFLVEYTLETSIGAAFYLFYTLWFMKMADESAST